MCIRMWWMGDNAFTCPWLEESIWNLLFWDEIFNIMTNDALSTLLGFAWHVNRNRLVSSHSICTLFITNNGIINPVYDNFLYFTEILSVLLKLIMRWYAANRLQWILNRIIWSKSVLSVQIYAILSLSITLTSEAVELCCATSGFYTIDLYWR